MFLRRGHCHPAIIVSRSWVHVGDPVTQDSDFVLHFDGGAFRDLGVGGAGAILWLHNQGRLQLLSSYCVPLLPCIDAAYAEAAGAAYAVLLAGRYLPTHTPNKIIIKGDNRPVIDFMSNTGKYRRTDLQQLLTAALTIWQALPETKHVTLNLPLPLRPLL